MEQTAAQVGVESQPIAEIGTLSTIVLIVVALVYRLVTRRDLESGKLEKRVAKLEKALAAIDKVNKQD